MKIIKVDNFNRESRSDVLIAENVTEYWAQRLVTFLNTRYSGPSSQDFFRYVPDDHVLFVADQP